MARFAPSVVLDGTTITPPGWMWVLGFAIGGCEWAVRECQTDAWKEAARQWFRERTVHEIAQETAAFHQRIGALSRQLIVTDLPSAGGEDARGS